MGRVLTVDVGNSRAKIGLFETGQVGRPRALFVSAVRLTASSHLAADVDDLCSDHVADVAAAIVAGSNPPARDRLVESWPRQLPRPTVIDSSEQIPICVDVMDPLAVGIDRLLTGYAAHVLFGTGRACIVVDSGTATTINLVTADGVFRGGVILPGLRLSARALHEYTARLPLLDTDQFGEHVTDAEAPVPGRSTEEAMRSGLFWGQLGAIREIRSRLLKALTAYGETNEETVCLVTGGGGRQLADHLQPCIFVDSLTLHGLALLAALRLGDSG